MVQPWINEYILLALRMDKAFKRLNDGPFVDYFYGPVELKASVESEPERAVGDLVRAAIALGDSLASQGFERERVNFLGTHVRTMEILCRILSGQNFALQDVIQQCLDTQPVWKPEAEFKQALALLDKALPGEGDLRRRYLTLQGRTVLPLDQLELALPLMQRILAEARRRTQRFVELPDGEDLEIHTIHDKPYGAANWYLGSYRSRLELNLDRPVNLFVLLNQMCHEGYPGHHTEFVLKEQYLYRNHGYLEQSVFIIGPQLVIAEGIASLALDMIFTPDQIADWMIKHIFPELDIKVNDIDLPKLIAALAVNMLDDLGGNLVKMRWDGYSDEEIIEYALEYTPHTKEQIRQFLQFLKSPLKQIYAFTYYQGRRLMQPLLQDDDRLQVFRRLLTEPVYPSLLAEWAGARIV
ncbi:MAG TPA: hypothetical protein VLA49_07595 [Anaerolineales bacterium]|nr:hypothetical protein [Anaerolineales bacterium]